jgi:hypothetical protein
MRKFALKGLVLVVVIGVLGVGSYAIAGGGSKNFKGLGMEGYQENPDVSSVATGDFKASLSDDGTKLEYELSYSGLEAPVLFAHVHFGKFGVNGGVSYFLCGGSTKPAPCPQEGTVTGEIVAADVIGPAAQGIAAGEFAEIVAAMRAGNAYANVHTQKFPGGEIRAQINDHRRGND